MCVGGRRVIMDIQKTTNNNKSLWQRRKDMNTSSCVAMVLAGGRGERLGALTRYYPKPIIYFGGNHRIIDFTLNNCKHSEIDTVGILSQHLSSDLRDYIYGVYDYTPEHSDVYVLPPRNIKYSYHGTADAVYKNIEFIERLGAESVLVLSGNHIYNMDYTNLMAFHREKGADVTLASTPVPVNETFISRGIHAGEDGRVYGFEEKTIRPAVLLASIGVCVFKWSTLKRYLLADSASVLTRHDFSRDILPKMLGTGKSIYTYLFDGYWRDVGTVSSLWQANMDLIDDPSLCQFQDEESSGTSGAPSFIASPADVSQSILSSGCTVFGRVERSVLSDSVNVGKGSEVVNSVVMPGAYIGNHVKIYNAVIGTNAVVMDNTVIGTDLGTGFFLDQCVCSNGISLVAPWLYIREGKSFKSGSHICKEQLLEYEGNGVGMPKAPDMRYIGGYSSFNHTERGLKHARSMAQL